MKFAAILVSISSGKSVKWPPEDGAAAAAGSENGDEEEDVPGEKWNRRRSDGAADFDWYLELCFLECCFDFGVLFAVARGREAN